MFRRVGWLAALVSLMFVALGCTADRTDEANRVRDAVTSMPGVKSVDMSYVNDFENGPNFWLTLDMPEAGIEEIVAVATRIRDTMGDDFDGHRQRIRFTAAEGVVVARESYGNDGPPADLNPERVGADAKVVRALIPVAGRSTWVRNTKIGSRLSFDETPDPDAVVSGALPVLTNETVTVEAPPVRPIRHNGWELAMPLAAEQWRGIARIRDGMPVRVFSIAVTDGRMSELEVELPVLPSAAADLTKAIDAVGPTGEHPLTVSWWLNQEGVPSAQRHSEARICGRSSTPSTNHDPMRIGEYVAQTYVLCAA